MSNPAAILNGKAILWGLTGLTATPAGNNSLLSGSATTATYYASYAPQTAKLKHKWESVKTKDDTGNTQSITAVDEMAEVSIDLIPTAATLTLINGTSGPLLLQPNSKVTLVFANYATLSGDWIYAEGADVDLKNAGAAGVTLKLSKWANATQNALLVASTTA